MRVVASIAGLVSSTQNCSGQGYYYPEDVALGLPAACECLQCFTGVQCEIEDRECALDVTTVELSAAMPWFDQNAKMVEENLGSHYHMDYLDKPAWLAPEPGHFHMASARLSSRLNSTIRELHRVVGNAETDGYQVVVGSGAIQLLTGLAHLLAPTSDTSLYAEAPFWGCWTLLADFVQNLTLTNRTDLQPSKVVELVTSPNNPNGHAMRPTYTSGAARISDFVYYWPHMTNITSKRTEDIMVFSMSKLAGFSSSRVGWALIKDAQLAAALDHYIFMNGQGAGVEAQYRAVKVLGAIAESEKTKTKSFFSDTRRIFEMRWAQLRTVLEHSTRYSLSDTTPGVPFAWVRCTGTPDCTADFARVKVRVGPGSEYGDTDAAHVRLTLYQDEASFQLMLRRIGRLVQEELVV
mmetsp:Transcript_29641/g.71205  ORF Transcript_29641/g.71205 Transcript_29641/m.71205 type:complete len:408 (-) Transcript_29641:197-1420(-)